MSGPREVCSKAELGTDSWLVKLVQPSKLQGQFERISLAGSQPSFMRVALVAAADSQRGSKHLYMPAGIQGFCSGILRFPQ